MRDGVREVLEALLGRPMPDVRVLVVAAHPDDETLGASVLLGRGATVLHVTDGAPADDAFVPDGWKGRRDAYRAERRRELARASAVLGVDADGRLAIGVADQGATGALAEVAAGVEHAVRTVRPDVVVSHAYEGGHPDHDAVALACRIVVDRLGGGAPVLAEMALYHAQGRGTFLGGGGLEVVLDDDERARKRDALACFASQREVLAPFGVEVERFRRAPRHDFSAPPHPGPLHYERLGWPETGAAWRARAAAIARSFA